MQTKNTAESIAYQSVTNGPWAPIENLRELMTPLCFTVRLPYKDFNAEVYKLGLPLHTKGYMYQRYFTFPWIRSHILGKYGKGVPRKMAINWSATMKGFGMDPAIHIRSSRHSKISKHKVNKTSVPTEDKVTGEYEYSITSTGVLKQTDIHAFVL